jgi:dTDP-4-amino-4,6-dideoxygalactose transaminase
LLAEIPGIKPAAAYPGCTRPGWSLFPFRYEREHFAGASRKQFLQALRAEGIPCSGGYASLAVEPFLHRALESRAFQALYSPQCLKASRESLRCPETDALCQQAVWLPHHLLLGEAADVQSIIEAIDRIQKHCDQLLET